MIERTRADDVWRDSARRIRDSIVFSLHKQIPCNVAGNPLGWMRTLSGMAGELGCRRKHLLAAFIVTEENKQRGPRSVSAICLLCSLYRGFIYFIYSV